MIVRFQTCVILTNIINYHQLSLLFEWGFSPGNVFYSMMIGFNPFEFSLIVYLFFIYLFFHAILKYNDKRRHK